MAKKRVKSMDLPLDLIMEIFLRVSVKTLLRFRSVCKSWLSLISNNNFVTSHFEHAATCRRLFVKPYALQPLSIDVDGCLHDDSAYDSLGIDFFRSECCLESRGSCRGFLFLHNGTYIYLLNPSTGLIKQIPDYPIILNDGFELLSGFAYDPSTDDYLIVSGFCEFHPNHLETGSFKFMIFSMRANKWKPIEVACRFSDMNIAISEFVHACGLFLNGSIHWMVFNNDISKNVIIAFDLKEMSLLEIPLPDDFILSNSNNFSIYYGLLEDRGLISAWMKDMNTVKIWVMQKSGVPSSWTKIIQFSVDPVLHSSLYIVCLTMCGDIIGTNGKSELVKFNDKGQLLEQHFCHKNFSTISNLALYTESLFSLPVTGQT